MKKNLFLAVLIIFVFSTRGLTQVNVKDSLKIYQEIAGDNEFYSVEALRADLTQIKNILIDNHPAVFQFTNKEIFERNFNEQIGKISRPMNLREFYLIAAPIVKAVHCVHTRIDLPDKFWNNESQISFPIKLTLIGGKAYVISFYKNENLVPTGDPNLNLEVDNDKNLAVITIKSFAYYQEKEKFYSFVDKAFEEINKSNIQNIILDLRDNMGGDPYCTSHLLSYLESKPVPYFAKAQKKHGLIYMLYE